MKWTTPSPHIECQWKDKDGNTLILIKVKPDAKKTSVDGLVDVNTNYPVKKALHVSINAQPEDNKANKELIEFMAEYLGVAKSQVVLLHGEKSRIKVLVCMG